MFRNAKRIIFHDILYNYSQDLKDIRNNKYKDNFIYIRELLFVIYIYMNILKQFKNFLSSTRSSIIFCFYL